LKSFVLLINLSEFLLAVILYDVVDVYLSSFKENFSLIWVGMHAYFYLLALYFNLLLSWVLNLLLFLRHHNVSTRVSCHLFTKFGQLLSSHLLNELFLIGFVFGFLDLVQLNLSFHGLLLHESLSLSYLFSRLHSVLLSLLSLFFLLLLFDSSSLFSQLFQFLFRLLRSQLRLILSLACYKYFLFEIQIILVILYPVLCHLYTNAFWIKIKITCK